jgi:F-type H+-transporting ATPase subunit a
VEEYKPLFQFNLFGHNLEFPVNIVIQWIIIALVTILVIYLTRDLKKVPNKKQSIAETIVIAINNLVKDNMGEKFMSLVPYIGTVLFFLFFMNLTGLIGFDPPTRSYGVALGMALISFLVIQGYTIKKIGVVHYIIGYTKPVAAITPLNIVERGIVPLSLSLRLFGNMTAATVIMGLLYNALRSVGWGFQIGLPILGHLYFDLFDGALQMVIFTMLTMINIKIISEH